MHKLEEETQIKGIIKIKTILALGIDVEFDLQFPIIDIPPLYLHLLTIKAYIYIVNTNY